jgi:hypothetical protein
MRAGRPFRFLAVTVGSWTALRVVLLWPSIDSIPALIRAVAPPLAAATLPLPAQGSPPERHVAATATHRPAPIAHDAAAGEPDPAAIAVATPVRVGDAVPAGRSVVGQDTPASIPPPLRPTPVAPGGSRLTGSAWLLTRGGGAGTLTGGRLGGSQAGVRVT